MKYTYIPYTQEELIDDMTKEDDRMLPDDAETLLDTRERQYEQELYKKFVLDRAASEDYIPINIPDGLTREERLQWFLDLQKKIKEKVESDNDTE